MKSTLTFHGGAGTVTGANFLLDTGSAKMLVDCGTLEQESRAPNGCDTTNSAPFPYDVRSIDTLIVTHAHADHIGRIPKLVRDGFRGPIHSTHATLDLSAAMFADALSVMRTHAQLHGCELLYEEKDIEQALALWQGHEYHEPFKISDVSVEFLDAGHILGSAMVKCTREGRVIIFTGDLGNTPEPLLRPTESTAGANYLVIESVYGDRLHEGREGRREVLRRAVEETRQRKGTLLIPSFSIERTQILLAELDTMMGDGSMQSIPVFLDAPLAIRVTEIFRKYPQLMNEEIQARLAKGDDPFSFPGLTLTRHTGESRAIHKESDPKVIIAGAGMSGGGRIRSHEKEYLSSKHATVLFSGYQAPGTLGRRLADGEKKVKIDDAYIRVHAHIEQLTGYSGHADRDQLLQVIEEAAPTLTRAFVTMGEPKSSLFLAQRAQEFLSVDAVVPVHGETQTLEL